MVYRSATKGSSVAKSPVTMSECAHGTSGFPRVLALKKENRRNCSYGGCLINLGTAEFCSEQYWRGKKEGTDDGHLTIVGLSHATNALKS